MTLKRTLPWKPLRIEVIAAISDVETRAWSLYPTPDMPPWKPGDPIDRGPEWEAVFEEGFKAVTAIVEAMFPNADPWEICVASGDPTLSVAYDRAAITLWQRNADAGGFDYEWLGQLDYHGREEFVRLYHDNLMMSLWDDARREDAELSPEAAIPA